jgi:hypothetical protein
MIIALTILAILSFLLGVLFLLPHVFSDSMAGLGTSSMACFLVAIFFLLLAILLKITHSGK